MSTPRAFMSYSWDEESHKAWVKSLSARLRGNGVDLTLDRWAVEPGDQLPRFMETSVRENDFVVIICTPNYKWRSDNRHGGAGYEGDIMTGEVFAGKDQRASSFPFSEAAIGRTRCRRGLRVNGGSTSGATLTRTTYTTIC